MATLALPEAWVVRCKGCSCLITCWAIDHQAEHLGPKQAEPPLKAPVLVACSCCWSAYRYLENEIFRGEPQPSESCRRKQQQKDHKAKSEGAILIAASTIAAIRLRGAEIQPSPKLKAVIHDSVSLARLVLSELQKQ